MTLYDMVIYGVLFLLTILNKDYELPTWNPNKQT